MKRNVTTYLSREEIRELVTASDAQGALSVLTTWAIIAATFVVLAAFPTNPIVWLLAIVILAAMLKERHNILPFVPAKAGTQP